MNLNLNKALSQVFAPISNVVWDIMSNKTGIKTESGIHTLGDDGTIDLNPFDAFTAELPAFSQLVPIADVKKGDVIVSGGKPTGWITEVGADEKRSLTALSLHGHVTRFRPKRVSMFGVSDGITVVRSPFDPSASAGGMGGMNPMMLMAMMGDNKSFDSKTMMLMAMMGGNMGTMNPMMLMALMGDNGPFKKGA